MTTVRPFRALRYDPKRVELRAVLLHQLRRVVAFDELVEHAGRLGVDEQHAPEIAHLFERLGRNAHALGNDQERSGSEWYNIQTRYDHAWFATLPDELALRSGTAGPDRFAQ